MRSDLARTRLAIGCIALLVPMLAVRAAAGATEPVRDPSNVILTIGRGMIVDCPDGVLRVATSSPEIVDAVAASGQEVLFHAKSLGQATMFIWTKTGERKLYEVTVEPNLEPLRRLVRETFPGEDIDLRASRDSLSLVGKVSTQALADRALAL